MTYRQNHEHARSERPHSQAVRFEFTDPEAGSVYIAGTFNNWQPDAKPMYPVGNGRWVREAVLPIGTYEYCLVVDGEYCPDPSAPETVPNAFVGGRASILKVVSRTEPMLYFTQDSLQQFRKTK